MRQQNFSELFIRLESLSTLEHHQESLDLVQTSQQTVASLIAHLSELNRKKGHLELGYTSCFHYCVQALGMSEGAAFLKMQVANICRKFPLVLEYLAQNRINLSVAALLSPVLNPVNVECVLSDCAGKSKSEVKIYLSAFKPVDPVESGVRKQAAPAPVLPPASPSPSISAGSGNGATAPSMQPVQEELFPGTSREQQPPRSKVEPASPGVFNHRFSAKASFLEKLKRLAEVLGVANPEKHQEEVLEKALELALEMKDPERKRERRLKREKARAAKAASRVKTFDSTETPAEVAKEISRPAEKPISKTSRHIPAPLREQVLHRAGYRCEYRGPLGDRCRERTGLVIDHIQPYALQGGHTESNLRALCKRHNLWKAERDFGAAFIRGKIAGTK